MREGFRSTLQPALLGAGCTTAAGDSIAETWDGIVSGRSFARSVDPSSWKIAPRFSPRACLWRGSTGNDLAARLIVRKTLVAYREAFAELDERARARVRAGRKFGVVLATTKGSLDDEIWKGADARLDRDFLSPILGEFLTRAELSPARTATVSNACASALSAFALARAWLAGGELDDVLVLAVDRIGPFVLHGFHSLRAVTDDVPHPFAADRSGLLLGEASAALFLSAHPGEFRIAGVGVDAEGFAVTRPAESGASLHDACLAALADGDDPTGSPRPPDLVIAHGTATEVNDPVEARVLSELFPDDGVPITASKGAIGHTLGASGAIDLILAREAIRRGEVFTISQTTAIDPKFRGKFLVSPASDTVATIPGSYARVLVTSLGFGGIHAAAILERAAKPTADEAVRAPATSPATVVADRSSAIVSDRSSAIVSDRHAYRFPVKVAPEWAPRVERWYQLDPYAFGMADAARAWRDDARPDAIFLASPAGSNATDSEFAKGGARSPALFVHSLPNVRSSALCQVLEWHGPLYCLQSDPATFADATEEARRFHRLTGKSVWVVGIERVARNGEDATDDYLVRRFRIGGRT